MAEATYYFGVHRELPYIEPITVDVEGTEQPVTNANTVLKLYYVAGLAVFDHCVLRTLDHQVARFQLGMEQLALLARRKTPIEFHAVPDNGSLMDVNALAKQAERDRYEAMGLYDELPDDFEQAA